MLATSKHAPVISGLMWIAEAFQLLLLVWVASDNYGWARLGQTLVAFFVEPIALGIALCGARSTGLRPLVVVALAAATIALLTFVPWGAAC